MEADQGHTDQPPTSSLWPLSLPDTPSFMAAASELCDQPSLHLPEGGYKTPVFSWYFSREQSTSFLQIQQ